MKQNLYELLREFVTTLISNVTMVNFIATITLGTRAVTVILWPQLPWSLILLL